MKTETNIFEQASRTGLVFNTARGTLTDRDLWNLPLSQGVTNLYDMEDELTNTIGSKMGTRRETSQIDPRAKLALEIVTHIIETREAEIKAKEELAANEAHNAKIDEIIEDKEDKKLRDSSIKDLKKMKR